MSHSEASMLDLSLLHDFFLIASLLTTAACTRESASSCRCNDTPLVSFVAIPLSKYRDRSYAVEILSDFIPLRFLTLPSSRPSPIKT